MYLVIDIGNTNQKAAVFRDNKLTWFASWRNLTEARLGRIIKKNPGITQSIISSVIEYRASSIEHLKKITSCFELTETTPVPIINKYRTPATLGKDRLASAVAGAVMFPEQDCLVINAGTCITYDFINRNKEYIGGAISPGMQMRFRALNTFTFKLPLVSSLPGTVITGTDTESSIGSGVINGITGEIEYFVNQYRNKYPDLKVILSGGDANYLVNRLKINIFALPNIVLYGLHEILRFNVEERS
jgi:type III pantothenate kinase